MPYDSLTCVSMHTLHAIEMLVWINSNEEFFSHVELLSDAIFKLIGSTTGIEKAVSDIARPLAFMLGFSELIGKHYYYNYYYYYHHYNSF